jgi:signal transduction histidine kinase
VDVDVPDDLTIQVHKGQFSQVITNLLSNAVKFSYQGGTNRFKAKRDGHAVHLWIEDAGTGISNVDQKELFKRFSSYQKKGTKGEASTGVGLFICKRILEQHHGDIEAQSEGEDKGTTFHITLLRN